MTDSHGHGRHGGEVRPRSIASYVRELKPTLPAHVFARAGSRLLWLPVHLAVIAAATWAIATRAVPWPMWPVLSLAIGASFGGLSFLAHETLHGAVVRGRVAQRIIGGIGFAPFLLSSRLWIAWHNRAHHGHTNDAARDPDLYPTLAQYQASRAVRAVTSFSLGGRRWIGALSLLVGFTGQSLGILARARRQRLLSAGELRLAVAEASIAVAWWIGVAIVVGPLAFLFVYVIPLVIGNIIIMSFILTNHGLSPLPDVNDPLVNSLSVTVPRLLSFLTLDFGYHVEHHIFPSMSGRHARAVTRELRARWPDRYQSMPIGRALLALHRTARVYADTTTLLDPRTGRTWPTLGTAA